jgi:hypothetical protein
VRYRYSHCNLTGGTRFLQLLLEVVPGALSWSILIGLTAISLMRPFLGSLLIVAFLVYWVLRLVYMNLFLILAFLRLRSERATDWNRRLEETDAVTAGGAPPPRAPAPRLGFLARLAEKGHRRALANLARSGVPTPRSADVVHLVIIPIYSEPRAVIEAGLDAMTVGTFPADRIIVALAVEERAAASVRREAEETAAKFRARFRDVLLILHPANIEGEMKAKGANATYAARRSAEYLKARGVPFDLVVVSCFDSDTVAGKEYFSALTYHFLTTPDRLRASFQPIPVFHNNIWEASAYARVLDVGTSFFQLIEATNPEELITFSSHSMSFQALVEADYWPVDTIADDSGIFWKTFIHYDGDYHVVPMHVSVSMDVAQGYSLWNTLLNVYRQKRRWAWGVENFPLVIRAFLVADGIPLRKRLRYGFKLLERAVAWATWPLLLGVISWLPIVFASRSFTNTVVYYSFPRIKAILFCLASMGLITCGILSVMLLPREPRPPSVLQRLRHASEWILLPIVGVFLSGIPALDAQTRLMLHRHMGFWVTPKQR